MQFSDKDVKLIVGTSDPLSIGMSQKLNTETSLSATNDAYLTTGFPNSRTVYIYMHEKFCFAFSYNADIV
jgi:hypothetical protein